MAFPKELLSEDEEIAVDLRPHWLTIVPAGSALITGAIVLVVLLVLVDLWSWSHWVGIALVLIPLGFFAHRYIKWATTHFVVTNERVISRFGVVAKHGIEIPLDEISTVTFSQSVFERLIGAGDLGIESSSEGGVQTFENVRKPNSVQQEIYRMGEAFEARRVSRMGHAIGAATESLGQSIPEQIRQLGALRDAGTITPAEFDTSKADLLRRL